MTIADRITSSSGNCRREFRRHVPSCARTLFGPLWIAAVLAVSIASADDNITDRLDVSDGIVHRLDAAIKKIKDLDRKVEALRFEEGTIEIRYSDEFETGPLLRDSLCPKAPDPDAKRGLVNVREPFKRPFKDRPRVLLALQSIEFAGGRKDYEVTPEETVEVRPDASRIVLKLKDVDKTGFYYDFHTYCTTRVWKATAVWVALPTPSDGDTAQ